MAVLTVTKAEFFAFWMAFDEEQKCIDEDYVGDVLLGIDEIDRLWLCTLDYARITVGEECDYDSDDILEIVFQTQNAIEKGYTIVSWADEDACMVIGIRPEQLQII